MLTFLAQAATVSGPLDGWGSLVLQAGAFGLLTYIVVVLAPRGLKEARDEREAKDTSTSKLVDAIQDRFDERVKSLIKGLEAMKDSLERLSEKQAETLKGCQAHGSRLEQLSHLHQQLTGKPLV